MFDASEGSVSETISADEACQYLREAGDLLREDPGRRGSTIHFGGAGQLVATGDMHGNLRNFDKLQRFCALDRNPGRSVLLHELVHEDIDWPDQADLSIDLLVRAAKWKCDFPDNVFMIQSNHELAQLRGQEITKGGRSVLEDFGRGVRLRYGDRTDDILEAVNAYVAALPLAARCENGVFIAHSLPEPITLDLYDIGLFDRDPTPEELAPGGTAYSLVWGRFHSPEVVERFAKRLGVECFVIGHTPQEEGYAVIGKRLIIIASDHNHGVFVPIDLARKYTSEDLAAAARKFVSVA